jgi:hypothetical protein
LFGLVLEEVVVEEVVVEAVEEKGEQNRPDGAAAVKRGTALVDCVVLPALPRRPLECMDVVEVVEVEEVVDTEDATSSSEDVCTEETSDSVSKEGCRVK